MKSFALFTPLLAAISVSAHGFVSQITIDGKVFNGNVPTKQTNPSAIRQITDPSPIKGAANQFVNCGTGAKEASLVAQANPGSKMTFSWKGEDLSNWPHNTGPMLTYMSSCSDVTCDKFNSTQAKWFKVDQVGRLPDGTWAQATLMSGAAASVTLPSNLAAGNYLIRHEIIALHLGTQLGGAEFYPSCAQLKVGGSQTGTPKTSDLVSLPGAYHDADLGILDKNAFDPKENYPFPGPALASFISGATTSGSSNSSATSASGPTPPAPTGTPKKSGHCKANKNKNTGSPSVGPSATSTPGSAAVAATLAASAGSYYPRHMSRIMRRHFSH